MLIYHDGARQNVLRNDSEETLTEAGKRNERRKVNLIRQASAAFS